MLEKCQNKKRTNSYSKPASNKAFASPSNKTTKKGKKIQLNNIKKIESIESDITPKKLSKKQNLNLKQFEYEVSKLNFCPIGSNSNVSGNYENYLSTTLAHISKMKSLNFDLALDSPSLYEQFPKDILEKLSKSERKILILDLDETLIHADFNEEFANQDIKYDKIISFYSEEEPLPCNDAEDEELTDDDSKDLSAVKVLNKVGIFLRPGVNFFLETASKYFEIGVFTASVPEYADAVINYLDPENKFIKFRLYRDNCINVGDLLRVKNLNILKNVPLKKIILVDNNMYSFAPQLSNGILINSFINDKNDSELSNLLSYLMNYIYPAEDVRKVNEEFFGFKKIIDEIIVNSNDI